jgi:hypothetical protein
MTDDFPLPSELRRIEQLLSARPSPRHSEKMKERFLSDAKAELRRQKTLARWAFAAAMAASVLVWLNLSLSAAQATDYGISLQSPQQSVEQLAGEIRQLLPDIAPREAVRQAVLLRAGADAIPCAGFPAEYASQIGNKKWVQMDF